MVEFQVDEKSLSTNEIKWGQLTVISEHNNGKS